MKAKEILEWAVRNSINFEDFHLIDVPSVIDPYTPQDEEWWNDMVGACPPSSIQEGKYLLYYKSSYDEINFNGDTERVFQPDAEIELSDDTLYLYLIEDY